MYLLLTPLFYILCFEGAYQFIISIELYYGYVVCGIHVTCGISHNIPHDIICHIQVSKKQNDSPPFTHEDSIFW